VQYYLGAAISSSTRRTYDSAIANWQEYCSSRGWCPADPVTSLHAEEWLAALADRGRHKASTIRTYKAALSTWHEENSTAANPLQSSRITRLITGIEAANAEREATARRAKPKSAGVTMEMVRLLAARYERGTAHEMMMVAAAALATAAALRPSELLGSRTARRALVVNQLRFFDSNSRPLSHLTARAVLPDHCTVTLRVSKTNQRQNDEPVHISTPAAVRAIWSWRLRRHADADNERLGEELFRLPDRRPLRMPALLGFTTYALRQLGQGDLHLTGKCFRIGGASTLTALGANEADLRGLGRWHTNMWTTYADPEAKKLRDIKVRRRM
jgi:hypothetical protein